MDSSTQNTHSGLNWQKALDASKGIIPWLVLAFNLIYGYAVKTSTSERTQQQQLEDHIAVMDMRERLSKLQGDQQGLSSKIDTFIELYGQQQQRSNNGTR